MSENRTSVSFNTTDKHNRALQEVSVMLWDIGVPANMIGFCYLQQAILLSADAPALLRGVTTRLYPLLAAQNQTTSSGVERAIRHAIETAWDRGEADTLAFYFGSTVQRDRGKPTNSEFISMLAARLSLQLATVRQAG